ncbi:MAG: bifunctional folylpolyglutamate synthase/dihydrofolate synthase [Ruminococcaceae bacterium]|nr:bifunctional folylpolyglutamate synthase/dihydrofolate synthase [Oscillospiraceae bacterium]
MTYKEVLEYIHSLGNFSMPATLERITMTLEKLGNPQSKLKAIHIAGTNGKGSVSAMLSSVFKTAGYRTGLFISPYIIDFRERIQINGEFISEADLVSFAQRVISANVKLTEFEFITAVAFLYFAEHNIDILICETGLGGRLDATNALENKIACVITKIGLDHTAILGDTIEKITEEKCGILRNCPVITTANQDFRALEIIKKHTGKLFYADLKELQVTESLIGNTFIYKGKKYSLGLSGDFQIENALTVIEAVNNCGYNIPYNIIYNGLSVAFFPARMEIISRNPLVVLDGAHNPDGADVLANELKKHNGRCSAIIGMMRDKDCEEFLKSTLCYCKTAVAVEVSGMPRSLKADDLSEIASKYCECVSAADYETAVKIANNKAENDPIFVFGSLYLASAIRPLLKEYFK